MMKFIIEPSYKQKTNIFLNILKKFGVKNNYYESKFIEKEIDRLTEKYVNVKNIKENLEEAQKKIAENLNKTKLD